MGAARKASLSRWSPRDTGSNLPGYVFHWSPSYEIDDETGEPLWTCAAYLNDKFVLASRGRYRETASDPDCGYHELCQCELAWEMLDSNESTGNHHFAFIEREDQDPTVAAELRCPN